MTISAETYELYLLQGKNAPCNGCTHEEYCKLGHTCAMYRAWERKKGSQWAKDPQNYEQIPDRPYG